MSPAGVHGAGSGGGGARRAAAGRQAAGRAGAGAAAGGGRAAGKGGGVERGRGCLGVRAGARRAGRRGGRRPRRGALPGSTFAKLSPLEPGRWRRSFAVCPRPSACAGAGSRAAWGTVRSDQAEEEKKERALQLEREDGLAAELARLSREKLTDEKMRQQVRENR